VILIVSDILFFATGTTIIDTVVNKIFITIGLCIPYIIADNVLKATNDANTDIIINYYSWFLLLVSILTILTCAVCMFPDFFSRILSFVPSIVSDNIGALVFIPVIIFLGFIIRKVWNYHNQNE
jgi:hypothetical protein